MSRPAEARCETCPYVEQANYDVGFCRRDAPTRAQDGQAVWPRVRRNDWCGEHPAFAKLRTPGAPNAE